MPVYTVPITPVPIPCLATAANPPWYPQVTDPNHDPLLTQCNDLLAWAWVSHTKYFPSAARLKPMTSERRMKFDQHEIVKAVGEGIIIMYVHIRVPH
jgi:hypothetical protein